MLSIRSSKQKSIQVERAWRSLKAWWNPQNLWAAQAAALCAFHQPLQRLTTVLAKFQGPSIFCLCLCLLVTAHHTIPHNIIALLLDTSTRPRATPESTQKPRYTATFFFSHPLPRRSSIAGRRTAPLLLVIQYGRCRLEESH